MEYSQPRANPLLILAVLVFAITIGICSYTYIPIEVMFAITGILFLVFLLVEAPKSGLYVTILILPISWSVFLNIPLLNISGLKIPVVLPLIAFLYLIFVVKPRFIEGRDQAFFAVFIALFTIAVVRSYPYLQAHYIALGEEFSLFSHFTTNYLRPFMIILMVIMIACYVRSEKELTQIVKVVLGSVLIGFPLIISTLSKVSFTDFEKIREQLLEVTGMHPGYFANYFLVLIPLTLLLAIKMSWKVCYLLFAIEVVSVALTFSRASYVVALISIGVVLVLCKKWKVLLGVAIISPMIYMMIPNLILNRALTGLAENNVSVISAGRVDSIWEPLLEEMSTDVELLLLGNGRYGIFDTTAYRSGAAFNVNNAHNILLDCICDGGVITLIFILCFFLHYLWKFYRTLKLTTNPLHQSILLGSILGILGFIMKGATDGVFWPESSNAMVYVLLGLSIAVVYRNYERLYLKQQLTKEEGMKEKNVVRGQNLSE